MKTILLDALKLTKIARSQGRDAVDPEVIKEIEPDLMPVVNRLLRFTRTSHLSRHRRNERSKVDRNGAPGTNSLCDSRP